MNYIILDLEFNQTTKHNSINNPLMFEIIQIGAIKLDMNLQKLDSFNYLVKPTVHNTISPFIEELTNITDDMVQSAQNFNKVYNNFLSFVSDNDYIIITWGTSDIRELLKNINYHKLSKRNHHFHFLDLQSYISKLLNYKRGTKINLKKAVETFNIPVNNDFHDAYNDAFYTSELFKRIYKNKL